ncbi:MAG TPA: hypothetical protein VLV86_17345 [Vicinamibacterales bacterium]|nr:hypothetical protein [Vicinamibacterales bacterium]
MRSGKTICTMLGIGMSVALFASAVQAQPEDKRTYFTFSGPVALPGVTLPAGRYLFRIIDTTTSRKVIQVLSDDQKTPYAMMNTINDTRRDPAKDATVSFYESARGTPAAVKSWWYPGETIGYQFIYPRAQAKQLAKNTGQPVLTTKAESTKSEETKTGELARVDANGRDVDVNSSGFHDENANSTVFNRNTPAISEGVNRTPPQAAQNNTPAPNTAATSGVSQDQRNTNVNNAPRTARSELPRTASSLPLVGLIGLLSALAFVTLRVIPTPRS